VSTPTGDQRLSPLWQRRLAAVLTVLLALAVVRLTGCSSAPPETTASSPTGTIELPGFHAAATPSGTRSGPRTVTVLGSGDVLLHPPLWAQAAADARAAGKTGYDFGPIYASIAQDVAGTDLATCELETPLAPPGGPFSGYPNFDVPPQVLGTLKSIGYRSCTTASNHTLDEGPEGVTRTLDDLDAAGLKHTGSARSAAEASTPLIITAANGVKIAQLAYTYGFNGNTVPAATPWLANEIDVPAILAAARRAKQAGANIVVVSLHWGTEYLHTATQTQLDQARQLLASPDVDLILGDHAHAVQPMQRIGTKWVIYCMGDQVSSHDPPNDDNREGVMPRFTFTETKPGTFSVTTVEAVPTWMQLTPTIRLVDLPRALADPHLPAADRATFLAAHARIAHYLDGYGATRQGLLIR
jgi:poly-gamma-glutamate synthesis protein (capsule biosynthesis protein)